MNQTDLKNAIVVDMARGDILGLISDGIYEYENPASVKFGQAGLMRIIDDYRQGSIDDLVRKIMQAAFDHGTPATQADDITVVLIRRRN